jgi:regulator of protease activity HflC (stomatin/prohibitin superfamily)
MRSIMKGGVALVVALLSIIAVFGCVEWLDAKHIMVVQYPNGSMATFTEPGPKPQWFGTVTTYVRRQQFEFDNDKVQCLGGFSGRGNVPMRIRFAEGGHAAVCGELSYEMPAKRELLIEIQKDFGNQAALEQALVKTALTNAIYLAGQTMTSTESSAERRSELLHYIEDQMKEGVYKTSTTQSREVDPLTKQERTITKVEIVKDKEGRVLRNNVSAIKQYGIQLVQTSISEIKYEGAVEQQIQQQQQAKAAVSVAASRAIEAEQQARTEAEQGKARAAKAEWEQKTIAAKEVEKARQEKAVAETHAAKLKEVAKLEKEAAEFTKQRDILLGQGESEKRRLIMSADGALEKRLEAWVEVNKAYATGIKEYKGNWVPHTVFGASGASSNGATALVDLLTAKTARDLQVEMAPSTAGKK